MRLVDAPKLEALLEESEVSDTDTRPVKTFGVNVARQEDGALLTGTARFVDDIDAPGMLHAAFVRSSHAHARIRGVDCSLASVARGVHAVLTLEDLRPFLETTELRTALPSPSFRTNLHRPVLADGETTYVGEAIAVVIARDRYQAEDAAALVEVDYEPLAPVSDCHSALDPDGPVVNTKANNNLVAEFDLSYGDVDAVFSTAPHVFKETYFQHRGGSHSMEGRGVVARYDELDDLLTVWSSTQTPQPARQILCELLGRQPHQVRVMVPDVGGGFGPKLVFYPEEAVVAIAALMLNKPVKWIEDRREHFISTTQERDQIWDVEIALDDDARILGVRGTLLHDHGAYNVRGTNVAYGSAAAMPLAYRVPAYRLDVKCVATNRVPVTPVRGAGQPQGIFAMERLMDRAARELGLDRAEIRRRNLIPAELMPYATPLKTRGGIPVILDSGNYPLCQAMALDAGRWADFPERRHKARAQGRYLGIGLANSVEGTGRGPYEAVTVSITEAGTVHVLSSAAAMGQSTRTMLSQIVAEQLGGDLDNVVLTLGDTASTPMGFGGFNSRQAVIAGNSAHKAACVIRAKVLEAAASLMKSEQELLEIIGKDVVHKLSGERLALSDISRACRGMPGFLMPRDEPGLQATEQVMIHEMTYGNASAVVEVEVDVETGAVVLQHIAFIHDCGRAIHPKIVEGQILGGIAHGVGNALFEEMRFDATGQPLTTNLAEYLLVTSTEMPPITLGHLESPTPLNPLGIKGVGEAGVLPIAAAIASAVENALEDFDVRITRVPISPVELLETIEQGRVQAEGRCGSTCSDFQG